MKNLLFVLISLFFFCCSNHENSSVQEGELSQPEDKSEPQIPATDKLKTAIELIETQELQSVATLQRIAINNVRYRMISMKDYYEITKDNLQKTIHLSGNKEKTQRVIAYLDQLILKAPTDSNVYKIKFHLDAALGTGTIYNQENIKYLREDLTEIKMIFPNL